MHELYQNNLAYKKALHWVNSLLVGDNSIDSRELLSEILSLKTKTSSDYEHACNKLRTKLIHQASSVD